MVIHWLNGKARFVLCNNVHAALGTPLVTRSVNAVPLTLTPLKTGGPVNTPLTVRIKLLPFKLTMPAPPGP